MEQPSKIERIDTDAAFVEWRDENEAGRPYEAVLVGGFDYVLVKSPEITEELEAELEKAEAAEELEELEAKLIGDFNELRRNATEALAGAVGQVNSYRAEALELEREKVEAVKRLGSGLTRIVDELKRLGARGRI